MKLTIRSYQNDNDYWHIREFLRQVMLLNKQRERSWHVARWDYWWWFGNPDLEKMTLEEKVFLWETGQGEIAAVLNPEAHGHTFAQVHPGFCTTGLLEEMITIAEENLAVVNQEGQQELLFWAHSQDQALQEILTHRSYHRCDVSEPAECLHRRLLGEELPERPGAPGYTIRPLGDGLELLERCYASGLGFHDDIQAARKNRDNPAWYHHIQSAPLYRRDLDLVAGAGDGSIASFCTIWFDDVTRTAYFEPVATVPAHRRHGLGQALMTEGLHRLKRMGCQVAFVGGYSETANQLYFSVMGPQHDLIEPWKKVWV